MCISCVCDLLCKIISFAISLLFIVGLILLILWLTGIIFTKPDAPAHANYQSLRSMITSGGGGH